MKQVLAYCLLISFVVLFAPRELFHDCEHEDHTEQTSTHQEEDSDCSVCEYDLSPAEQPVLFAFNYPSSAQFDCRASIPGRPTLDAFGAQFRRGPPALLA